jgi:hypothetical protein
MCYSFPAAILLWLTAVAGADLRASEIAAKKATLHRYGDASFVVPKGWSYSEPAGQGRALLTNSRVGIDYCVVAVYKAVNRGLGPDEDLRGFWRQVFGPSAADMAENFSGVTTRGYTFRRGIARIDNEERYASLIALEAPDRALPILVLASNRGVAVDHEPAIRTIVDSLTLHGSGSAKRTGLGLIDLVGEWQHHAAEPGEARDLIAEDTYEIDEDGSFAWSLRGVIAGRRVLQRRSGTLALEGDEVIFRLTPGGTELRYRFVGYAEDPKGETVLTLLPIAHEKTAANIARWAERWTR